MKYIISIVIIFLFVLFVIYNFFPGKTINFKNPFATPIPQSNSLTNSKDNYQIDLENTTYLIHFVKIENLPNLLLIPNFTDKKISTEIIKDNNCKYGINAGFYTKANQPLGIFMTDNKYWEKDIHNQSFFNGFFYKTKDNKIGMSGQIPNESLEFIFQSGPLFTTKSKLSIIDDSMSRRSVIAKDVTNTYYFLTLLTSENANDGPYLKDIPRIIELFNAKYSFGFSEILNLDGGSASAFYIQNKVQISELTVVGSFLCGK